MAQFIINSVSPLERKQYYMETSENFQTPMCFLRLFLTVYYFTIITAASSKLPLRTDEKKNTSNVKICIFLFNLQFHFLRSFQHDSYFQPPFLL